MDVQLDGGLGGAWWTKRRSRSNGGIHTLKNVDRLLTLEGLHHKFGDVDTESGEVQLVGIVLYADVSLTTRNVLLLLRVRNFQLT